MLLKSANGLSLRLVFYSSVVLGCAAPVDAKVGYGYKKSEDPLVLGIKRIIFFAREDDWAESYQEFRRLSWQFKEFRDDLNVELEKDFEKALGSKSLSVLSREICRVMYFALKQKFHWNRLEECKKYVPAKSRLEAAIFYYEQVLSIGVRDFDRKNNRNFHRKIVLEFQLLRGSIGTAGLFGIGARKPDLKTFQESSESILAHLRMVYPYLKPATRSKSK